MLALTLILVTPAHQMQH